MTWRYDIAAQNADNETLSASPYLTDLSGKGHDLLLNNFAFALESGVGKMPISFLETYNDIAEGITATANRLVFDNMVSGVGVLIAYSDMSKNIPSYRIRVSGLSGNLMYYYRNAEGVEQSINISEDREYSLPICYNIEGTGYSAGIVAGYNSEITSCTIDLLPDAYEDALLTDGVDDYGVVQNMTEGVKMLFMDVEPIQGYRNLYDQRNGTGEKTFSIYNSDKVAYSADNSGDTYIDGVKNETKLGTDLLNTRQVITIVNKDVSADNSTTPEFFTYIWHTDTGYADCAFYRSVAFDAVPDGKVIKVQDVIDYVIKTYFN